MKDTGSMNDFDALLKGPHNRKIKPVMGLVVLNHISDAHDWCKQAKSSRNNRYRNYYHWWNAEKEVPGCRWFF